MQPRRLGLALDHRRTRLHRLRLPPHRPRPPRLPRSPRTPSVWALAYGYAALTGEYARGTTVAIWYLTSHVGVIMWAATVPEHSVPRRARKGKAP